MRRPTSHRPRRRDALPLPAGHLVAIDPVAILHHSPTVARTGALTASRRNR